ncbi:MAG: MFS transporter [Arenicellales bacterium]
MPDQSETAVVARIHFVFLNIGHFVDHLLPLVFASVAALTLTREWEMSYAQLIPYAIPGVIAFGLGALPAGWLADRWSREKMMAIFFVGIGISAVATAMATTPVTMALGLFAIGLFGSIYHPVGIAMVIQGRQRTGVPLAVNGVFGNLGVACAALFTGLLIQSSGWKAAFIWPGVVTLLLGVAYIGFLFACRDVQPGRQSEGKQDAPAGPTGFARAQLIRIFLIVFASTALGGLIFQSTTFALPKIVGERMADIAVSVSDIGWYAFGIFALASIGQLIVGFVVDRWSLKYVFLTVAACQSIFFLAMVGLSGSWALAIATAFMLVVFGQIPINDVLIGRVTKTQWRSRALAARYIITFSISATAIPMIALVHTNWGFDIFFLILAAAAAAISAIVLFLPRLQASKNTV